ncbi:MAG: BREX system P-loop protein BrxC, partial [Myxococcales bacterium]|nr:BREX system P-loop protein BrxC [Myxococcales bacterium]
MLIKDLFVSDVTRDIPPVVYFHEQNPEKLKDEVDEYIITGGWPESHPNHKRVPRGIHEEYVRLLTGIAEEYSKKGGPELPCAWISGFYGSGKSSFSKLLGLALDNQVLPDGRTLAEAWLKRDTSPNAKALRDAWARLIQTVNEPLAVVFDVGSMARDNEHVHGVAIRQLQRRLGYCADALVADFELNLERDGEYDKFLQCAERTLGSPWTQVKDRALVEEDFSLVLSELYPEKYTDPMSWFTSRAGTHTRSESPEEAVKAIGDMLRFRANGRTLFFVVDEVSQYVINNRDRVDRLRAFATALGSGLRG